MLNSFIRIFDYPAFEKKLRHYFRDSAPINADVAIGLRGIRISCSSLRSIACGIDENLSVEENIKNIINSCTNSLYPKMLISRKKIVLFSDDQKRAMLLQGFSVDQIREKENRQAWSRYTITRFNEQVSTIDYIEGVTGARYRAHLYQPLIAVKDKIWELASDGIEGMENLYQYLASISKQEVLSNSKNESVE